MSDQNHMQFNHIVRIAREDGRFLPEAFLFVSESFQRTQQWVQEKVILPLESEDARGQESEFHVSGQELLVGIRKLARERWGEMAPYVLGQWRVRKTEDFGTIVFLMVTDSELDWRKRDCDSIDDFSDGYDFETAFLDEEI